MQLRTSFGNCPQRGGIEFMLHGEYAGSKELRRVRCEHRHFCLRDDRTCIHFGDHEMDGCAMGLRTGRKRPRVGIKAAKRR